MAETAIGRRMKTTPGSAAGALAGDPFIEFAKELVRDCGYTYADVAAIALGDDYGEFVTYLGNSRTEITTMNRLATAMHRFALSRATAVALARLEAEIAGKPITP